MYDISFYPFPCLLSPPDLLHAGLAFRFGHPPCDEGSEEDSEPREDEVDFPLPAESFVDDGEELGDEERGDPVGCKPGTLSCAHGFWTDEFIGQDEWYGAKTSSEGSHEKQCGHCGEDLNTKHESQS